jgi:diguanylate cyclase (GGDEF)-like protein
MHQFTPDERHIVAPVVAKAELVELADVDYLTGLPNRNYLMSRLGEFLAYVPESVATEAGREHYALLFLDLDRFKAVNDSLGYPAGDQLLQSIAYRLETCLREYDTLARIGGDEFAILLDNLETATAVTHIAERIQQILSAPFYLAHQEVFITVSIGIALSTPHGISGHQQALTLLRDADIAMYQAKSLGRDCYQVFTPAMHTQAVDSWQLANDLRRAPERQELELVYQPIFCLASGQLEGFEALVRWHHPQRGLVYPGEFIPVAEETGIIIALGEWILAQACQQFSQWQQEFLGPQNLINDDDACALTLSVNISGRQFSHPQFGQRLLEILEATEMKAQYLKLELTESVVMANGQAATQILRQLKNLNIQLALDDFGTGYSSLSYLSRFPLDTLKVDRTFIQDLAATENWEVVRTILALAENLNLQVTAEGVETLTQLNQLKTLNCGSGQGYFFSQPLAATAAAELLKQHWLAEQSANHSWVA